MQIRDNELVRIMERLGHHYKTNINNRIMRKALLRMDLNNVTWARIERLTEVTDLQRNEGYSFHELYEQVMAMALFIDYANHRLLPNIRQVMMQDAEELARHSVSNPTDKVLREMAIRNFGPNLGILSDILNELYVRAVALDKEMAGDKTPVYATIPDLKQLGRLLTQ